MTRPNKISRLIATLLFFLISYLASFAQKGYCKFMYPFIGSEGNGNAVLGPSWPFGMVKPEPDCLNHANSGYKPDLRVPVYGFSQVHVTGAGGAAKYGILPRGTQKNLRCINAPKYQYSQNLGPGRNSKNKKRYQIKCTL